MHLDDDQVWHITAWLDSKVRTVSEADPILLKEFLLEYLGTAPLGIARENFTRAVCSLTDGIVKDTVAFSNEFYDIVLKSREIEGNCVVVSNVPSCHYNEDDIIAEFQQFGSITQCKLSNDNDSTALIRYVNNSMASMCINSVVPFFNNRFVSVRLSRQDSSSSVTAQKTPVEQLSVQLKVKSKQLSVFRNKLKDLQLKIESVDVKDSSNIVHYSYVFHDYLKEMDRKQLSPSLLYHLRNRLEALRYDLKSNKKKSWSSSTAATPCVSTKRIRRN